MKKSATRKNNAEQCAAEEPRSDIREGLSGLRQLDKEERKKVWKSAQSANRVHQPDWLRSLWERRKEDSKAKAVAKLISLMRRALDTPEVDDPDKASRYLARLVHIVVERFGRLVSGGVLDTVLPYLNALPLLYSNTAGNGATKWTWAHNVFKDKKVGTQASMPHGRSDPFGKRTLAWRCLAEDAVTVASYASLRLSQFDELRGRAVAYSRFAFRRLRARYGVFGIFYLLDDGSVLLWPDWLEKCRGLPLEVKAAVPRYQEACLALAQEFFGDRFNKHTDELLEPLLKNTRKHGQTDGRARMEAAQLVAEAVGRLGGEK